MELPILKDILLTLGLSIAVLFVCHRIRVATIVGFLLTGILVGPHGLGLISAQKEVEILAEIGVVLLLFTIGIEFSLEGLLRIKRLVFVGGALQVLITISAASLVAKQFGLPSGQAIFIGFLVSLSSTAIVLKLLQERAEVESPHGQTSLAILIFQDVAVVPMMLLIPFLAGATGWVQGSLLILEFKGIGLVLLILVSAKWIVPQILYQIARTRSRELFLLSILAICFTVAFLTHALGLSLALGAFYAGLIISETEYGHETLGHIIPFRDVFTSLFFVSIGMLLDLKFLVHQAGEIALMVPAVMALKTLLTGCIVLLLGFPFRTALVSGLALCQVGEFSFILFMKANEFGLLGARFYQFFLDVSVLTMGITPFIIAGAPRLANIFLSFPLPRLLKTGFIRGLGEDKFRLKQKLQDHLVIVGFGLNGRNLARAANVAGIPYVVVEMNPQTVRSERKKGEPIYYGDASQGTVLEQADIKNARAAVIAISDPVATRKITAAARRENPKLFIVVRTRFLSEMKRLYELGANEVVPEEFETSIEIFSRILAKYLVPRDEIEKLITEARAEGYEMFRSLSKESTSFSEMKLYLPDVDISTLRVEKGSAFVEKSLSEIDLRKKYGVTLLAIRRDEKILSNPDANTVLQPDDLLIILGSPIELTGVCTLLLSPEEEDTGKCEIS